MNKQEITKALRGKVIEFGSLRPFAIEKVIFHDGFIITTGNGYAVPILDSYIEPLIRDKQTDIQKVTVKLK